MKLNNMNNISFNIENDYINIKTTNSVTLKESFTLVTKDGEITLDVRVMADFEKIPTQYHEVFLNILTSKYLNKVSFTDNPFSECKKITKKRWWEFWKKSKVLIK